MIKLPNFIKDILSSDSYSNKNNPDYDETNKRITELFSKLYPKDMVRDDTGRLTEPNQEYDLTLEEFEELKRLLEEQLEERIRKIKQSDGGSDEDGETYEDENGDMVSSEENDDDSDVQIEVILVEIIPVKVLMGEDWIDTKDLEIYDIEVLGGSGEGEEPNDPEPKKKIWVWISGGGCDDCNALDGAILDSPSEAGGVHPNCGCRAEEMTEDEYKERFGNPDAGKQKKLKELNEKKKEWAAKAEEKDKNFESAYGKLAEPEGGYTDGKDQVRDEPTNMGIKQSTLDNYRAENPDKGFPQNVKDLQPNQAKEIYKEAYWDNTQIPNIQNDRIRDAVFDMNVMGGAGSVTQRALNSYADAGLEVDGNISKNTINALNSIPDNKVPGFMDALKAERLNYLRGTANWPTAQNGWTSRTNSY